jgi:hypothetical protein
MLPNSKRVLDSLVRAECLLHKTKGVVTEGQVRFCFGSFLRSHFAQGRRCRLTDNQPIQI